MRFCVWIAATALCFMMLANSGCTPNGPPVQTYTPPDTSKGGGKKPVENNRAGTPIKIE